MQGHSLYEFLFLLQKTDWFKYECSARFKPWGYGKKHTKTNKFRLLYMYTAEGANLMQPGSLAWLICNQWCDLMLHVLFPNCDIFKECRNIRKIYCNDIGVWSVRIWLGGFPPPLFPKRGRKRCYFSGRGAGFYLGLGKCPPKMPRILIAIEYRETWGESGWLQGAWMAAIALRKGVKMPSRPLIVT